MCRACDGEAERWKGGGASGSEGLRVGVVLGGGAVGLIAWVENAEREERKDQEKQKFNLSHFDSRGTTQGPGVYFSVPRRRISVY